MRDKEVSATVTLEQVFDLLQNEDIDSIAQLRAADIGEAIDLEALLEQSGATELAGMLDVELPEVHMTVGELVDDIVSNPDYQAHRADGYTFNSTVGDLIDLAGEDRVADILQNKVAEASQKPDYDNTQAKR